MTAVCTLVVVFAVAEAGTVGVSLGNAAKPTRGSVKPRATTTDNKDKILKERYKGCLRLPSRRGVIVVPVDGTVLVPGMGREVLVSNKRVCIVPFVEAYSGSVLDEVKMNVVVTIMRYGRQITMEGMVLDRLTESVPDAPAV